jgi:WD40 repeat protein
MAEDTLKPFSRSTIGAAVSNGKFTCNPTIDLIATVGDDGTVYIWRANDQLVAKHTERSNQVGGIRWKEDGVCLHLDHEAIVQESFKC